MLKMNRNSNSTMVSYLDSVMYFVISAIFASILMVIPCLMAKVYCRTCRKLKKSGYETDDGYEEDVEDKIETGKPKYD